MVKAEAKEVVGGFWMIDVKPREEGSNGPGRCAT
jgi:hypothetical protein